MSQAHGQAASASSLSVRAACLTALTAIILQESLILNAE